MLTQLPGPNNMKTTVPKLLLNGPLRYWALRNGAQ